MKRTTAIFLCILLLIPAFAVCASAAEPGQIYTPVVTDDNSLWIFDGFLPKGVYKVIFTTDVMEFVFSDFHNEYNYFEGNVFYSVLEFDRQGDVVNPPSLDIYYDGTDFGIPGSFVGVSGLTTSSGQRVTNISFEYLGPLPSPGRIRFVESIESTLNVCIEWVGEVTISLLSGELNSLLLLAAIPIAITVLMLTVKIIKKSSWGV